MTAGQAGTPPQSQTLDRGLRILEHLAAAGRPLQAAEIGTAVGLHRSITYRLLRTLEGHQLVDRLPAGQYTLGLGLTALARGVRSGLQGAAGPWLHQLVEELGMTAFLVVRSGGDAVTVLSVEPQDTAAHVVYRPGSRHPTDRGAPGLALLMPAAPAPDDRPELQEARRAGWAVSRGEVVAGLRSVAAPVVGADGGVPGAIAVVYVDENADVSAIGQAVVAAARKTAAALG
ncbi:IclR family transcriptional regulator [Modestobacter roseus]|uniref:IclR family transcriptional regulator n=1 Tax=Modestobacter roseus TaxID=1181884 RepID=A0A562INY9_9ACTN|nr:IclR family transcriptional regulator [Modestobacter roseus]MQA34412.1 helix-turn-helix domain-containing protein [Modestobacter roseus]TWH72739.1 IclR family transcriptional regulator [Modestobacter roseus]